MPRKIMVVLRRPSGGGAGAPLAGGLVVADGPQCRSTVDKIRLKDLTDVLVNAGHALLAPGSIADNVHHDFLDQILHSEQGKDSLPSTLSNEVRYMILSKTISKGR